MGTVIRPEISKNNRYWIGRHRYYELRHFCLQYPLWKKAYCSIDGFGANNTDLAGYISSGTSGNPTARCAEARAYYADHMKLVEQAAIETDSGLAAYILHGVTEGVSFDCLKARFGIPCGKDTYYDLYRKFFWILSKVRD